MKLFELKKLTFTASVTPKPLPPRMSDSVLLQRIKARSRSLHDSQAHKNLPMVNMGYVLERAQELLTLTKTIPSELSIHYALLVTLCDTDFIRQQLKAHDTLQDIVRSGDVMLLVRQYIAERMAYRLAIQAYFDERVKDFVSGKGVVYYLANIGDSVVYNIAELVALFKGDKNLEMPRSLMNDHYDSVLKQLRGNIASLLLDGLTYADHQIIGDICLMHPHKSVKSEGKLAHYATLEKMLCNATSPIKVRAFLHKVGIDDAQKARSIDALIHEHDITPLVSFHKSDDLQGWIDGYSNARGFSSCMTISYYRDEDGDGDDYGVAYEETARCYATAAHGLPDNGLELAVLKHPYGGVVARAITWAEGEDKFYIRNYGDDRLEHYLINTGYKKADMLPRGVILYTEQHSCSNYTAEDEEFEYSDWLKPYVDGNRHEGVLCWHGDKPYIEVVKNGDIDLQTTGAFS